MAKSSKRELWVGRIAAWERSGLSRRVWCGRHGINVHTLDYWRRQLRAAPATRRPSAVPKALVPVMVAPVTPSAVIEIRLTNGVQLLVPSAVDAVQVAQWVRALAAC